MKNNKKHQDQALLDCFSDVADLIFHDEDSYKNESSRNNIDKIEKSWLEIESYLKSNLDEEDGSSKEAAEMLIHCYKKFITLLKVTITKAEEEEEKKGRH